jgi:lipopolysaccharide heptosyltransferase II
MKQKIFSLIGSSIIRLIGRTLSFREVNSSSWKKFPKVVYGFFHGEQFLPCYWHRGQGAVIMTSLSKDGEIQTGILNSLGYRTVRGSSSRGGERALVEMIRYVKKGASAAFAVDGPKGPLYEVKPGAVYLALKAGVPLIPVASCSKKKFVFEKAWDKYEFPVPFSKAAVIYGKPLSVKEGDDVAAKCKDFELEMKKLSGFIHKQFWSDDAREYLNNHPCPKILIIQPSRIGDVVFTIPLLSALRKKYPQAWISWVVDERCAPVIEGNPDIDEMIVFDRSRISIKYLLDLRKRLRSQQFDISIDLHGLFKSALLAWFAGARFKLASASTYGMKELSWMISRQIRPENAEMHCIQRHLAVARYLGCPDEKPEYKFSIPETASSNVRSIIKNNGIDINKPMVVMHPGGGWVSRRWFPERFAQLADRISAELGYQVLLTGGKEGGASEKGINETILASAKSKVYDLTGLLDLKELAALYKMSKMFVGSEAGPMHLATALQIPVVAIIGPTNPFRTGPYGDKIKIVRQLVDCQPCRERNCKKVECMKRIHVEDVFDAVKSV